MTTDLSCFYIKQDTHMETDVPVFFSFLPYHSFPFHPINPPQLYPAKGRDNEKVGLAPELFLLLPCLSPPFSSSSPCLCALQRCSYILFASRLIST